MFITFEGIDGSGKTTQTRILARRLEGAGFQVVLTREPGDIFRELLLHSSDVVPAAELFLFMADRAQHTETTIRPALLRGRVVLCDRYADSTVAYQGYGRGMDLKLIHTLNRAATSGLVPDLTVLLD
ncbi:MAG: dTMP kinase, partial [Candidatus Latescibacterota bacterium]